MESLEDLVVELKALAPDQFDRVARMVHELSSENRPPAPSSAASVPPHPASVPPQVLEQAVRSGWPRALFTDVIGQIPEDFNRQPQPPYEVRQAL
jgi:hypothetical protein